MWCTPNRHDTESFFGLVSGIEVVELLLAYKGSKAALT